MRRGLSFIVLLQDLTHRIALNWIWPSIALAFPWLGIFDMGGPMTCCEVLLRDLNLFDLSGHTMETPEKLWFTAYLQLH